MSARDCNKECRAGAFGDGDDTAVVTGFKPDDVGDVRSVDLGEHPVVQSGIGSPGK